MVSAEYRDRAGRQHSLYGSVEELASKFKRWKIDLNALISEIDGDRKEFRITKTINGVKRRFQISITRLWFGGGDRGRYYEHEAEAKWALESQAATPSRMPRLIRQAAWLKPLTTPQAFSELLCRGLLGGGTESALVNHLVGRGFRYLMRATGTDEVLVARGMGLLSIRDTEDLQELIREADRYGADESWSLNVALSSWMFSRIYSEREIETLDLFDRFNNFKRNYERIDFRDPRRLSMKRTIERLDLRGAAWNRTNFNRALYETQSATLFVARFPVNKIAGFGGDSESSLSVEAEVKALPCPGCIERIFVLAKRFPGARRASDAERREWCLSYYNLVDYIIYTPYMRTIRFEETIGMILHADVKCDSPRIIGVNEIRKPPEGFTWWVVE